MILAVTLNAALDVTYDVDALVPHATHRVREVRTRAGGKGVNVARVLRALGHDVVVSGFAGGATGAAIRADLAAAGLPDALVPVAGESRRTVTVVAAADGDATLFNEPGPEVSDDEWAAFADRFAVLAAGADAVVLSGSLPPGVRPDAYARLVAATDARTVVDADGPVLAAALAARPDVVKPNAAELAAVAGAGDPREAAAWLRARGAGAVVASLGADGLLAVTADGAWRARPPRRVAGNPTGAGDACVAALTAGLVAGAAWPDLLRDAVSLSAAAVAAPVAGDVDLDLHRRHRAAVHLEEIHAAHTDR
ncbi:1-phosphofructokinase family hexose kinase [Pseudonocardia kunmingensis]|uniref:Tagatose 6-phosphate kinase n=1 Tax=Pseudonocardia kunmingensis TaxID=630975 RepID=A0A543DJC1_9PSEU|nr:hexose kinase [Pseudonocardia kunmingensis]TQM09419.1 tagatose 6-phosphate kinase [Pseudonocardia kunmingensis]